MSTLDHALTELENLVAEQRAAAVKLDAAGVETIATAIGQKISALASLPREHKTEETKGRITSLRKALLHNLQLVAHARDACREVATVMRDERDGKTPRLSVRG